MKLVQQRLLRGANLYATVPCLMALIDLGEAANLTAARLDATHARVARLLPELRDHAVASGPADLGDLIAVSCALVQQRAGAAPGAFTHSCLTSRHTERRIVFAYQIEHVAQAALALTLTLFDTLLHEAPFDLAAGVDALRAQAQRYCLPPVARAVADAALARGIPVMRVSEHASLLQLGWGSRQRRFLEGASGSALLGRAIAADRQLTRALLEEAGIGVPRGATVDNIDDACRVARRLGGGVAVWPADTLVHSLADSLADSLDNSLAGAGPATGYEQEDDIAAASAVALAMGERVIVERAVSAPLRQITVLQGRASVAPAGAADHAPRAASVLAERAAAKIGLPDAVVQVALADPPVVVGLRALARAPGFESAAAPDGAAQQEPGRIPIIAVTGTNGKTTTTLMIAHITRLAGLRTGCTTTQGVFLDGVPAMRGDCTGYWSHRAVLSAPQVDIAVLEAARGGILKRGLAFDHCTVAVMLNVSDDHLGLEGVDTVADLASVKSVVVKAASGAAVLNADDPHCVAMAPQLRRETALIYFSMSDTHPLVCSHVASGGSAVVLRGDAIVVLRDGAEETLMPVTSIACTAGGRARFNIANALAATAALVGAGFTLAPIVRGLASFASDAHSNPLRMNMFEVRGIRVIVDYAHNQAAYAALGQMARALEPGKLVGVVTVPGDRRDVDLRAIGAICARQFDTLVVYESAGRGRPHGQAAALICDGAREAADNAAHYGKSIQQHDDVHEAVRQALAMCDAGDVVAFACGTSLNVLVDALRPVDPESAERIARQIASPA